jgi:hypothetical protein
MLRALAGARGEKTMSHFEAAMTAFLSAVAQYTGDEVDAGIAKQCVLSLDALLAVPPLIAETCPCDSPFAAMIEEMTDPAAGPARFWDVPIALVIARHALKTRAQEPATHAAVMDEWLLTRIVSEAFKDLGLDESSANADALLVRILVAHPSPLDLPAVDRADAFRTMFEDICVQRYLRMNRHEGLLWLNKERMERLLFWFLFKTHPMPNIEPRRLREMLVSSCKAAHEVLDAADVAGYQVAKVIELLAPQNTPPPL